jgi:hypothetical protein
MRIGINPMVRNKMINKGIPNFFMFSPFKKLPDTLEIILPDFLMKPALENFSR